MTTIWRAADGAALPGKAIDTPERELLIDAIDAIAHAAGMRGTDIAGPFRDW